MVPLLTSRRFWSGALHIYVPSLLMMIGQGMLIPALPTLAETYAVAPALAVQVVTIQQVGKFVAFIPTARSSTAGARSRP